MHDAYEEGVVGNYYHKHVEEAGLENDVSSPSEKLEYLNAEHILRGIAWYFRWDHFSESSLASESIADVHMLWLLNSYVEIEWKLAGDQV